MICALAPGRLALTLNGGKIHLRAAEPPAAWTKADCSRNRHSDSKQRGGYRPMDEGSRDVHALLRFRRRCRRAIQAARLASGDAPAQLVEEDVDDRRGIERENLADQQSADHGDAQRTAQLRTQASAQGQRKSAQQRGHGSHHDRAETQQAGFVDRLGRVLSLFALGFQARSRRSECRSSSQCR